MAERMFEVLCQYCLRVRSVPSAQALDARCECGGQMCWCSYCQEAIRRLRAGERRPALLGLVGVGKQIDVWNEQDGLTAKEEEHA